jgi:hypothetical protein
MGIPTLIADNSSDTTDLSEVVFTSGITSAYDEYMFVFTDVNPATDNANFQFQTSIDGGSNYNVTTTNTFFRAKLYEDHSNASLAYVADEDVAQGTGMINFAGGIGSGADESASGILHLFSPASTTYVKHFYSRCNYYKQVDASFSDFVTGYANTTSAVNAIKFNMSSGNLDGLVQMYGIS